MRRRFVALSLAACIPALAFAGTAAERLRMGNEAAQHLEFDKALQLGRSALEAGDATPADVVSIHALLGQAEAVMGFRTDAVSSFGRALELEPALELPPTQSPRLLEPFRQARADAAGLRLSVVPRTEREADGALRTVVRVEGDRFQMVQGGRLYAKGADAYARQEMAKSDALERRWSCDAPPCAYYVALTDRFGNEILWAGSPNAPLFGGDAIARATPEKAPWFKRPATYLAVLAVALAGVGGYFGVEFNANQRALVSVNENRPAHYLSEAYALDSARRQDQVLMFSFLGAGVLSGGIAVVIW